MITNLLLLSKINYSILVNARGFIFATLLLIIIGLFLIPRQHSDYVTFYIGTYTGYPNALWVANLGAVLSNLIISFIGFFFLEGIYKEEINNGVGGQIRSSRCSNFSLFFYKWLSYVFLLLTFSGIIAIVLYIANSMGGNVFVFFKPFLFYSFPFLVLLAFIILFLDYIVHSRGLKISVFIILIFFAFSRLSGKNFDLLGINDFVSQAMQQFHSMGYKGDSLYGVGYLSIDKINYLTINKIDWLATSWYYRIGLIICTFPLLYLSGFLFTRYGKASLSKKVTPEVDLPAEKEIKMNFPTHNWYSQITISVRKAWSSLVLAEFSIFKLCFTPVQSAVLVLLWISSITLGYFSASRFLVPLMFILSFRIIESYVNIINRTNLENYYKTSIFTGFEIDAIKFSIINCYYVILLFPAMVHNQMGQNLITLVWIFSITALSLLSAKYLHSVKLIEVTYIVIFGSYLASYPVIRIF